MVLILVSPPVFGGVGVAHLGFITSVWWGLRCSSWLHHQCLVGSVLLILVSPPVFGGVRVAHLGCPSGFVFLCPVSCVPSVASACGLSIFEFPFDFP